MNVGDGAVTHCGVCWARVERMLERRGRTIVYTAEAQLRLHMPWLQLVRL